jgi:outer membrane protein assembly factor BamA
MRTIGLISLRPGLAVIVATLVLPAVVLLTPAPALAVGESITDVRILGNQRTEEDTVRSIAGVKIGGTLELDTLELVRERLHTAGLFSDVNVWWEQAGEGVRVNIAVKDKFPWAPVPTASWSANNRSIGLVFVDGNLFGRGKQLLIGGRLADVDSGAVLGYRDPALFGGWGYWQLQAFAQKQVLPEYPSGFDVPPSPERETHLTSLGFEGTLGIAWFRRVRTQIGWQLQKWNESGSDVPAFDGAPQMPTVLATKGAVVGIGKASLGFDFRAREFAVMTGTSFGGGFDLASPSFGSDLSYWKASVGFERGVKVFRSHNFIYSAYAATGHNLPFWNELTAGGNNLRGYLFQQYRGDSQLGGKAEYHFPLFSISSADFRALVFYDVSAVWFRDLPPFDPLTDPAPGYRIRNTPDARTFLPSTQQGFSPGRDIHNDVGAGFRFFLRSIAIPLVGFDAGYGIEARHWRFMVVIGA